MCHQVCAQAKRPQAIDLRCERFVVSGRQCGVSKMRASIEKPGLHRRDAVVLNRLRDCRGPGDTGGGECLRDSDG